MRAVVRHEYGDTSVLRVEEIDEPEAEPGTVVNKRFFRRA